MAPKRRSDRGTRQLPEELVTLIEGLASRCAGRNRCWLMGEQMIAEAVDAGDAPEWVDEAHPLAVACLGALPPQLPAR